MVASGTAINLRNAPPSTGKDIAISYPTSRVLLVTMQRGYNMLNMEMQHTLSAIWKWYDTEPSLRCAVITGSGKSFCAGANLKEWLATRLPSSSGAQASGPGYGGASWGEISGGFGGMSRRVGKKPIVGAVNGLCLGGGMEMAVNCDLVIASTRAEFGLPEVKRGVFAKMGALGRVVRFIGLQRASELALLGDSISPQKAHEWGIVNLVVEHEQVVTKAVEWAEKIASNSPDSIIVSRMGMLMSLEHGSLERGTQLVNDSPEVRGLENGDNIEEGLRSFKEKRPTKWIDSKL
ncbi:Enoyl-CoA hydratase [Taphrina deformans PYCC 5710]|uniref:Enoyl-CoA hydratase n=1 Tax=Taphrina deformans (strain PYCC 5710 / ATCC 11124 / CBS 356.35 / IMI 108563 / JCM 9778 / NBRC 8474) TaxID=1097556 RepID=R4XG58_TAPDE|nr:Enoyl-CoA hydratase [Taphrina deformans PYCC 5710]|eukprot:CCG83479.1 Enoyl-CoA hydratase [Taphrina deformans PYCC 5710]